MFYETHPEGTLLGLISNLFIFNMTCDVFQPKQEFALVLNYIRIYTFRIISRIKKHEIFDMSK